MGSLQTSRLAIPYMASSDPPNTSGDIGALAGRLDTVAVSFATGTLAARPVAGTSGRIYYATDVAQLYWDTGSAWVVVTVGALVTQAGDLLVASGPDALARVAVGLDGTVLAAHSGSPEGVQWQGGLQTYSPAWTAATTNPSVGNGTLTGTFVSVGPLVFLNIYLQAGSTTNGGRGPWSFGLPIASLAAIEQDILAKCFVASESSDWSGNAVIASGSSVAKPFFYSALSRGGGGFQSMPMQQTDAAGDTYAAVPGEAGGSIGPATNGSITVLQGSYLT